MPADPPPVPPAGLLVLHKPPGVTSRDAVNAVQRAARAAGWGRRVKVGHAGTLDPLATGVLVVCVGKATKLIARVQALPKIYEAGFQLHAESPSLDTESAVRLLLDPPAVTAADIEAVLPRFVGTHDQTPPAFSAIKVDGKRAYDLARRGEATDLKPRPGRRASPETDGVRRQSDGTSDRMRQRVLRPQPRPGYCRRVGTPRRRWTR